MARAGTPLRETLVIGLMPLLGLFLAGIAAREADGMEYGWAPFAVAFAAGICGPLVATVVLARRDRLANYLRLRREKWSPGA